MISNWGIPEVLVLIYIILTPVFWIIALRNIFRRRFDGINKWKWIIIVMFLPFLGSLIYLLINRKKAAV